MSDTVTALRRPAHRVSRRAVTLWTVHAITGWIAPLLAAIVAVIVFDDLPAIAYVGLVVLIVAAVAHTLVMPQWRYRVHHWEATEDAVYTLSGWVSQEWRVAPMSRIQTVDTQRGPLQQLLRLATVTVTTASAAGPLHIEGLDLALASELVDRLTATTQAAPGDAT